MTNDQYKQAIEILMRQAHAAAAGALALAEAALAEAALVEAGDWYPDSDLVRLKERPRSAVSDLEVE